MSNTHFLFIIIIKGPSWSWSYGSWIYNYLCNQGMSPLTLWVRTPLRRHQLDTTLCNKVCQWLGQVGGFLRPLRFPLPILLNATEILLKVAFSTINQTDHNNINVILIYNSLYPILSFVLFTLSQQVDHKYINNRLSFIGCNWITHHKSQKLVSV